MKKLFATCLLIVAASSALAPPAYASHTPVVTQPAP
jgi:hypothetical protein